MTVVEQTVIGLAKLTAVVQIALDEMIARMEPVAAVATIKVLKNTSRDVAVPAIVKVASERVLAIAMMANQPKANEPADIAPTDIAPTDIAPTDIAPTDIAPTDIAPTDIAPTDIAPTDIAPTDIAPTDIAPTGNEASNAVVTTQNGTTLTQTGTIAVQRKVRNEGPPKWNTISRTVVPITGVEADRAVGRRSNRCLLMFNPITADK